MADPTHTPTLPSTADAVPYVPVSWMAVGAVTVAGIFVLLLLALGGSAFLAKKPLLQPELLALPLLAWILSFAARRVIRNSEGTRTGEGLANAAWWVAVVLGPGYFAYILAIDYSIRRDAKNELVKWVEYLRTEDENNDNFNIAFLRSRDPGKRGTINPKDTKQIKGLFRDDYAAFEQSDLVKLLRRNRGEATEFKPTSVREWTNRPGGVECVYSGVLKCPEGTFTVNVPLRGIEPMNAAEGIGRQWGVTILPTGYIARDQSTMTRYGWLIETLEQRGTEFGKQFIFRVGLGPWSVPYAYHSMMRPDADSRFWDAAFVSATPRSAIVGGLGLVQPYTADFAKYYENQFFQVTGEPDAEKLRQFRSRFEGFGLLPPEGRLKNSPDKNSIITVKDSAVEVRVPCELPFPGADGTLAAARARVVVVCDDPALVAELKQLRSEAKPENGTATFPEDLRSREFKWRVARVESDMVRIQVQQQQQQGGPGMAQ
jgi:hypothetical protein